MATIVGNVMLAHSPLFHISPPATPDDPGATFVNAVDELRRAVEKSRPDCIVMFGPDHFRNFFYDSMPAFCIGVERVTSIGDYGTPIGDLPTDPELAMELFLGVRDRGFDPAISLHLGIDHGIGQPYSLLVPDLDVPVVPIMLNTSAPPLPTLTRSRDLGRAIGDVLRAASTDKRVLAVGSGGLSHWPPATSAFAESVDPAWRSFLIDGRDRVAELEPRRVAGLTAAGATGTSPVNIAWDEHFLETIGSDLDSLLSMTDPEIEDQAGNGGHEIRTWLAAQSVWDGPCEWTAYEPMPTWCAGMGCATSLL